MYLFIKQCVILFEGGSSLKIDVYVSAFTNQRVEYHIRPLGRSGTKYNFNNYLLKT